MVVLLIGWCVCCVGGLVILMFDMMIFDFVVNCLICY